MKSNKEPIDRIIELFESSGKSNNSIIKDLGLYPTAYDKWKKGKTKPTIAAINKIADYFDVSIDFIYGKTDQKRPSYPTIKISGENLDMTAWYVQKANLLTQNLSYIIDFINSIKDIVKIPDEINDKLYATVSSAINLLTASVGINEKEISEDTNLLLEKGSQGYNLLLQKYNIKKKDILKSFLREKEQ